MEFSEQGNKILKDFFNSNNKEQVAQNTKDRRTRMMSEMVELVNRDYSAPVNACGILDRLWERIGDLKVINSEVMRLALEQIQKMEDRKSQQEDLDQCLERVCIVQRELQKIEQFVEHLNSIERVLGKTEHSEDSRDYFILVKNYTELESLVMCFRKYFFASIFQDEIENLKKKIYTAMDRNLTDFLNKSWTVIGKNLRVTRAFKIFDELKQQEKDILETKILDTFYCARNLNFMKTPFREAIISKRHSLFHSVEQDYKSNGDVKEEGLINFYIGNIFLSHILLRCFPDLECFHTHIFRNIATLGEIPVDPLSKLRLLMDKLGIHSSEFDETVEKTVFSYFSTLFKPTMLIKLQKNEINGKIDEGKEFLRLIESYENEFDELFLKKIDDALVFILNNTPIDGFFTRHSEIAEIVSSLKSTSMFFKDYPFECLNEASKNIRKLAEKEIEQLKSLKGSTESVVKAIVGLKRIENTEFKDIFVDVLCKRSEQVFQNWNSDDKALFLDTAKRNLSSDQN